MSNVFTSHHSGQDHRSHRNLHSSPGNKPKVTDHTNGTQPNQHIPAWLATNPLPNAALLATMDQNNLHPTSWRSVQHHPHKPAWTLDGSAYKGSLLEMVTFPNRATPPPDHTGLATQSSYSYHTQCCYLQFSLPVPTNQQFWGPPVTPMDKYQWQIDLPIHKVVLPPTIKPSPEYFTSILDQLCHSAPEWQWPLFGPIWWLQPLNQLLKINQTKEAIMIVSDASVQKDKHTGFAWVIAHQDIKKSLTQVFTCCLTTHHGCHWECQYDL